MSSEPDRRPHSAEYFGEERHDWWNPDFLALIAARLGCEAARTLVDVGCGQCHWAATALSLLPGVTELVGVDREATWVAGADASLWRWLERAGETRALSTRFVEGDALALPLPDASADVVTCQTVLMHLSDPARAVAEMFRVVRPGGTVLLCEPENSMNFIRFDTAAAQLSLDALTALYRFRTAMHLGRLADGIDWDIGHRLLGLLQGAGGEQARVFTNDRANAIAPPYGRPSEVRTLAAMEAWARLMSTDSAERRTHAAWAARGGLSAETIDAGFDLEAELHAIRRAQVAAGTWHHAGGSLHYIAWARRPAAS